MYDKLYDVRLYQYGYFDLFPTYVLKKVGFFVYCIKADVFEIICGFIDNRNAGKK